MFKDKKEELKRLEEALLLEAQQEEAEAQQEAELEEAEALLDDPDDFGEIDAEAYRNYANQYGKVKAYNTDRTDAQLEDFSNTVYEGEHRSSNLGLLALAAALLHELNIPQGLPANHARQAFPVVGAGCRRIIRKFV